MTKRPGFLSPTGIVIAVVVLLGAGAVTHLVGPGLFSPGALNSQAKAAPLHGVSTHAELGHDCGACHPAPWSSRTMSDMCLDCHEPVAAEIAAKKGVHGPLAGGQSSPTCRGCHPEHHGASGALTSFNEATVPHGLTGFSLQGHEETAKGAKFTCADCHPKGYAAFDQAICADCHAAMNEAFMTKHETTFGKDCLACHDGSGNTSVDHSKFAFKLTGKHAGVACDACHKGAQSPQDYQQTPQDCYSCHAKDDEHKGAYGKDCGGCHTAAGWGDVTFDHKIFPVDHGSDQQQSTCKTCHPVATDKYTCFGCHAHTPANVVNQHEGKSLAELTDCVKCHAGGRGGGD